MKTPAANNDAIETCGYAVGGPLFCGMIDWLINRLHNQSPQQLWFLARDGSILHQVWQIRAPDPLRAWPAHYVLLSRRALQIAAFTGFDEATAAFLTSRLRHLSPNAISRSLGLPNDSFSPHPYQPLPESQLLPYLKKREPEILQAAATERPPLLQYLHQFLHKDCPPVALIDIGWHGSLQTWLARLLPQKAPPLAYSMALLSHTALLPHQNLPHEAFLGHPDHAPHWLPAVRQLVNVIELFTATDSPSLHHFAFDHANQPQPHFSPLPFDQQQIQASRSFHKGILRFAREQTQPISFHQAIQPVMDLGLHPSLAERKILGNLRMATFGEGNTQQLSPTPGLATLAWPPHLARSFRRSPWKPAFYKSLPATHRKLLPTLCPNSTQSLLQALQLWPQRHTGTDFTSSPPT